MSAEEFWKDDPQLFNSYRISFIKKQERKMAEEDYISWLRGLYIHDGNGKLFASLKQFISNTLASMFKGKKDNTKLETYPIKPYFELKKDKDREIQEKREELERKLKFKNFEDSLIYYGTMKQRYLKNMENNEKKGE